MAEYKFILPAMGEGVMEATITAWVKKEGDSIEEDETVVEVATDKVDSDVPSPIAGKLVQILKQVNEIAKIGEAIAIFEIEGEGTTVSENASEPSIHDKVAVPMEVTQPLEPKVAAQNYSSSEKYFSPLIKSMAKEENISLAELESIQGTGLEGRVTKEDFKKYVSNRNNSSQNSESKPTEKPKESAPTTATPTAAVSTTSSGAIEIIEMDRMRKIIAENMVRSKQTAPHVTSFIETDVSNVVLWRNLVKDEFLKKEGVKLTYMPIFVWAIVKAIKDFPMINVSVDGDTILKKKDINIGMATALPSGNLIVPVIKNADQYNLSGLAKAINDLATRARNNALKPHEIQGGTYTITNIGSFGNIMGTPIIPQPQVAILAVGAIEKKPAVIETKHGDSIGIRSKMFMSHAYDHRVVDGALGGMFLQRVHHYLENFDMETAI